MKQVLLSFIMAASTMVVGQNYHPMPADSATWTVVEYGYQTNPPITITGTWHYGLSGDTVIEGKLFSKMYVNPGSLGSTNPESCFNRQTAEYIAAIREDSLKKVWVRFYSDTVDELYYDFALSAGDTFCFPIIQPSSGDSCFEVMSVDSILIDGNYRRQIHFWDANGAEEWIEGIGSTTGWFGTWSLIGNIEWRLECFSENQKLVYGDSSSCSCFGTGISPIQKAEFNIYPNPATANINIETHNLNGRKFVDLYSLLGQKLKSWIMEKDALTIDISDLSGAEFFIVIRNTDGKQLIKKIIKNKP